MIAVMHDWGIEFRDYPFRPALVFPNGRIGVGQIRDIDLTKWPPEVRLKDGEILFVSMLQRDELAGFAGKTGIPLVKRPDVWSDLLEPYLDTQFSIAHHRQTLRRLERNGFSRSEVATIRKKVGKSVFFYNAFVWEWIHLGIMDVLDAKNRVSSRWGFRKFYSYAMEISNREVLQ